MMPTNDLFRSRDNQDINCEKCYPEIEGAKVRCFCRGFFALPQKSVHFVNKEMRNIFIDLLVKVNEEDVNFESLVHS